MPDRLRVVITGDGLVSVARWLEGEQPRLAEEPASLGTPLTADELEDLRWYLEDYLRAPLGVYSDRGGRTAARLPEWGVRLFRAVFGSGPAHQAYAAVSARGRPVEVVVQSGAPLPLSLPWELMRDPERGQAAALDGVAVTRCLPDADPAQVLAAEGSRLRVLMVISRPAGPADVGYQMIARPLLPLLENLRGSVDLVVLRPPTLARLEEVVTEAARAGDPFQIVHFDGHGLFSASTGGTGALAFEVPGGGWADQVGAADVARVIAAGSVPVVVLNACQSGQVRGRVEATVATRLLQGGVASVVAMSYKIYAVAAAEFMSVFYERLFAGNRISDAVTAARCQLSTANKRPSAKGYLPLADWMVPVHYARRDVRFPELRSRRPDSQPVAGMLPPHQGRQPAVLQDAADGNGDTGLAPIGEFVGRDNLFCRMEAEASLHRVVVLHGPAGIGKTELAKAFGRWWRTSKGVEDPSLVIFHSFEPGAASYALPDVINAIGTHVYGAAFAAERDREDQRRMVLELVRERRLLLIWDNFESVHTMPDPGSATPPLNESQQAALLGFLADVRERSPSTIIITSRTREDWLGKTSRIEVGSLADDEAIDYADRLLQPLPRAGARRADRAFGELMQSLDGHPLSMRLVLPLLDSTDPLLLLKGLQGSIPLTSGPDSQGRTSSLAASIAYSIIHLPADDQRALTAVALFRGVADAKVLGRFSSTWRVPRRFRGYSQSRWEQLLGRAASVGLLTKLDHGMYQIHPALPSYLTSQWRAAEPDGYNREYAGAVRALLAVYALLADELDPQIETGNAGQAVAVVGAHRLTLGALLGYSLDQRLWKQAQAIAQPLSQYLEMRGWSEESRGWVERIRLATEAADRRSRDLGRLELFISGSEANRHTGGRQLAAAENSYHSILRALGEESGFRRSRRRQFAAAAYLNLGNVARHKGDLDEAESWYLKALAIEKQRRNNYNIAGCYHQLGIISEQRGNLHEAQTWYRRSVTMMDDIHSQRGLAMNYLSLGRIAQAQQRLGEAETMCRQSRDIFERLGDQPATATCCFQLGRIAEERRQSDMAEKWYQQSLTIRERIGDRSGCADSYHQLGIVAQEKQQWTEARDWLKYALAINEDLNYRPRIALSYGQLGVLAERQGHPAQALEWVIRCIAMFDEFPHPATGAAPVHLRLLTAELGMDTLASVWKEVTGKPLPGIVQQFVSGDQPPGITEKEAVT